MTEAEIASTTQARYPSGLRPILNSVLLLLFTVCCLSLDASDEALQEEFAYSVGLDAYFYGYSTVALYKVMWKQVLDPARQSGAEINRFIHDRRVATPDDRLIPAPNNDTLYSRAWLDLTDEPQVLHIPVVRDRFYAFPVADFFHDIVKTLGSWNIGENGGDFLLAGPLWTGIVPKGVEIIRLPTSMAWILARTLTSGESADLRLVHSLQDKYRLTPLSEWSSARTKSTHSGRSDFPEPTSDPVNFFYLLNDLLRRNQPRPADEGLVSTFKEIGVHPSQEFNSEMIVPAVRRGLIRAMSTADKILRERASVRGEEVNNWVRSPVTAAFGTNYLGRAVMHSIGLQHGAPEMQAAYTAFKDSDGRSLDGSNIYSLTFNPTPPVNSFWALTMYGPDYFLVANPINRYSLGDRTKGLNYNEDGSLTVYLQHKDPGGGKSANWLPAPAGPFWVSIRAYLPKWELVNGAWRPPMINLEVEE